MAIINLLKDNGLSLDPQNALNIAIMYNQIEIVKMFAGVVNEKILDVHHEFYDSNEVAKSCPFIEIYKYNSCFENSVMSGNVCMTEYLLENCFKNFEISYNDLFTEKLLNKFFERTICKTEMMLYLKKFYSVNNMLEKCVDLNKSLYFNILINLVDFKFDNHILLKKCCGDNLIYEKGKFYVNHYYKNQMFVTLCKKYCYNQSNPFSYVLLKLNVQKENKKSYLDCLPHEILGIVNKMSLKKTH
jgi:hypothetical protein